MEHDPFERQHVDQLCVSHSGVRERRGPLIVLREPKIQLELWPFDPALVSSSIASHWTV